MTAGLVQASWLSQREAADAQARCDALVDLVMLPASPDGATVVHDLGAGTGSMERWLAPRLRGPQHWVLHDRDEQLLAHALADPPLLSADDAVVTTETRLGDLTSITAEDLGGAGLVTSSALLDVLTYHQLACVVAACVDAGVSALMTLTVVGRVDLVPHESFDTVIEQAFNDHQRRRTSLGPLLGPGATDAAVEEFIRLGFDVAVRPSPWRLTRNRVALLDEWFTGWVGAAVEQRPEIAAETESYAARRRAQLDHGELTVTVHHLDLLARPR